MGCLNCHVGEALGGRMYQKLGVANPYKNQKDLGRFELTKQDADKMVFKVPSLRNIAVTGPYFHDGSVSSLKEAVKAVAHLQVGRELSDAEAAKITAFLKTLTGKRFQ